MNGRITPLLQSTSQYNGNVTYGLILTYHHIQPFLFNPIRSRIIIPLNNDKCSCNSNIIGYIKDDDVNPVTGVGNFNLLIKEVNTLNLTSFNTAQTHDVDLIKNFNYNVNLGVDVSFPNITNKKYWLIAMSGYNARALSNCLCSHRCFNIPNIASSNIPSFIINNNINYQTVSKYYTPMPINADSNGFFTITPPYGGVNECVWLVTVAILIRFNIFAYRRDYPYLF